MSTRAKEHPKTLLEQGFLLVRKFGLSMAISVCALYWFFVVFFPKYEEKLDSQTAACLAGIREINTSMLSLQKTIDVVKSITK